ncbi:MAG: GAF domain-containing protein [Pseudomonadota bacterium]
MDAPADQQRARQVLDAVQAFSVTTADTAQPNLYVPLTFLLSQVRQALGMDVVFVSQFIDRQRVFEIVSAEGQLAGQIVPGGSDPLLDSYCQRIVDGRLPAIIHDTGASPEAASLAITRAFDIKAYLSAPVVLPNGEVFGTVCCISHKTRHDLREADARALAAVAEAVAASIDKRGTVRYASWTKP